jgi:hypothetical protein
MVDATPTAITHAQSPRGFDRGTRRARRWVAAMVVGLLVAAGVVFGIAAPASAYDEPAILSHANQSRAEAGLGPLRMNSSMNSVALAWAQQMDAANSMSHNPSYSSQIPGGWSKAGENVAHGYASGAAVHAGWMSSPGHKANILGDFTDIGIAHISGANGTWSVQVFAKYGATVAPPAPPAPAPAPAPAAPPPAPAPPAADPEPAPAAEPEATPTPEPTASSTPRDDDAAERDSAARDAGDAAGDDVTTLDDAERVDASWLWPGMAIVFLVAAAIAAVLVILVRRKRRG